MSDAATQVWETVYTVHDYFDGPRNGVANFRGQPHAFQCRWDEGADDWGEVFLLSPITPEQLSATQEIWSIWQRYRTKFRLGELGPGDQHPALASDQVRYEQLRAVVEDALLRDQAAATRAVPEFQRKIDASDDFEVRWTPIAA